VADAIVLPSPCVVVLVGPSGSGKTTWADRHLGADRVISSDRLRALVGGGEDDLAATADAFELLDLAVERRIARKLTTVIDTLGFDVARRSHWRALARRAGVACVCVAFETPATTCRARNRQRATPVPQAVLAGQLRTYAALREGLADEGFDLLVVISAPSDAARQAPASMVTGARQRTDATRTVNTAPAAGPLDRDDRVLRFGLQIPSFAWATSPGSLGAELRSIVGRAEAAGFASVWLMDHFRQIPMFGPPWHDMLESWTTLAHLAASTSTIRLGTLVTGITYRNLAHLAKIVATVDVLSGGRVTCGLGAAWYEQEHTAYAMRFPPRAERFALLEDALQLLPMMWGPGSPAFRGRTIDVPEAMCYPRPLQARVPLLVGGNGERRTLALVARYADACNLIGEIDVVRRKVAVLRGHCERFDRDPAEVAVTQLSTTLVGGDVAEVADLVERHRPRRTPAERWATQANAAIVADQVTRFRTLAAAGVDEAIVSLPNVADAGALERFAEIIGALSSG
jgi:F420-dependent oxidoreductase-like protein